jgi:hypothetical protein
MAGTEGAVLESVATTPADLAALLNVLHAGALADADLEDVVNDVLGEADADVVTLTGDGVFVPDPLPRCVLLVSRDDAWRLCAVAERVVGVGTSRMLCAKEGAAAQERCTNGVCAALALLNALACFAWGARVSVTIADDGVVVYDEAAVGVGSWRPAVQDALSRVIDSSSALFAEAMSGVDVAEVGRDRVALVSVSRLRRGVDGTREVTVRLETSRLDDESVEMLGECGDDEVTRVELFDSVANTRVAAHERPWPEATREVTVEC